ncbi:DNA-damage-inducible protein D [Campylobacter ureolyticus RIGS 9880]|uniref:DNA-damage-inducible protein D n=1 Tax=Campylobacter ureolyticus RIGS 9880 TaxID=1032069 RepID=A0AAU8UDX1_9BACT|nr:BRO family protein [Campylobacter ureolyticus]AKT91099.1 DNA-damage-inducible protein D [Campylobacter ureolyticus RIGS 9880]
MKNELTLFDIQNVENDKFELSSHKNGSTYWLASELATMLEYDSVKSMSKAINKAISVCVSIGHNVLEHIRPNDDNSDYKLSRFGCFLISMNADIKKPRVALAQGYFATIADAIYSHIESEQLERLEIREKTKGANTALSGVAKTHGVTNYAFFQNKGYMGMYNMGLAELRRIKGLDNKSNVFDFMGSRELAANLFRLQETKAKIETSKIYGQKNLENTAYEVGRKVRNIMIENDGVRPEMLARKEHIKEVSKELKRVDKKFKKIDEKKD